MTVQEALKQSGFTDEQIAALPQNAIGAFGTILTSAEQKEKEAMTAAQKAKELADQAEAVRRAAEEAKEAAELAGRSNVEFYETKIMPGLLGDDEKRKAAEAARVNAEAMAAFYKTQYEAAKGSGFVPADAPEFKPADAEPKRGADGKFVAGANQTAGSPAFLNEAELYKRVDTGLGTIADIQWRHQSLYNKPLPISPSALIQQAEALKLSPAEYAARTFKFAERESEMRQQESRRHDEEIAAAAVAVKQKEYEAQIAEMTAKHESEKKTLSERRANNPEVSAAGPAKIAEVRAAVKAGERKDPLKMTDAERRMQTRQMIRQEVTDQQGAVA